MGIESTKLSPLEEKLRIRATYMSLFVGGSLMLLKFWAFNITHSQSVFSDAMESIVNVVAASLAIFVIYYSAKPRDKDHPYGHGKIEFFSAAFEGGLIAFAAVMIIVEAIRGWLRGTTIHDLDFGILIVGLAGVINLLLGIYLIKYGKKLSSVALIASGKHVISDFVTSAGVVVGLTIVYFTNIVWIDYALALSVGVHLLFTGFKLVRGSIAGLMDEEDIEVLESLRDIFKQHVHSGIIQIHHVKVIRSGWYHHIDAHLVLPEFWDITQAHDKILEFEKSVIEHYEYGGEMNFHLDPCRQAYCQVCDLKDCKIRKEEFKERMPVRLKDLRNPHEPENFREKK